MDFEHYFERYDVPEKLKNVAILIMKRFNIFGECDAMYICNVIASIYGIGNGCGTFHHDMDVISDPAKAVEAADNLMSAYGIHREYRAELTDIIQNRKLCTSLAIERLEFAVRTYKAEMASCDEWNVKYLNKLIEMSNETIHELKNNPMN